MSLGAVQVRKGCWVLGLGARVTCNCFLPSEVLATKLCFPARSVNVLNHSVISKIQLTHFILLLKKKINFSVTTVKYKYLSILKKCLYKIFIYVVAY